VELEALSLPLRQNSKHYHFRFVNPWPRPLQQPHPPIWIPGVGSRETIEFVAQRRFSYMGVPYFHIDVFKQVFSQFREACEKAGYTAKPEQMGWGVPVYVAETDRQAREEFEKHGWYFNKLLLKGIGLQPPGYTSAKSAAAILKNQNIFSRSKRPGTISRRASFPSSAARRRCGRSWSTTRRSWASAWS
jgi:alkanesulfonate monooxygenase SsuD/methylene tetrahydromethanopterin reductase-like flavin-dependent oxidoreductase (luciferase family)